MPETTDYTPTADDDQTNVWAAISLFGVLLPILGVVAGHIGLHQTRDGGQRGRDLAIVGLVIGYAGIVTTLVGVALAVVFALSTATWFGDHYLAAAGAGGAPGASGAPG